MAGYLHTSSFRIQLSHAGKVSWHFVLGQYLTRSYQKILTLIFRLLQLKQPCLDFLCPFLDLWANFISDPEGGPCPEADFETEEYNGRRAIKLVVDISESEPVDESFSWRLGLCSGVFSLSLEPAMLSSPIKVADEHEEAQDSSSVVDLESNAVRMRKVSPSLSFILTRYYKT